MSNGKQIQYIISIYKKQREVILYLFFGGITFFTGIAVYVCMYTVLNVNELMSNLISWIAGITFSFFSSRRWVFKIQDKGCGILGRQFMVFSATRVGTFLLQELLLFIFVTRLQFSGMLVKLCTETVNIILNYIASKWLVFRKGNDGCEKKENQSDANRT